MPMLALLFERFERSDQPRHHAALLRCVSERAEHGFVQLRARQADPGHARCFSLLVNGV